MVWMETCAVDERMRFVIEVERGEHTVSDLCRIYRVSRETGYVWLRRYRDSGVEGLRDLGRAPVRHPNQRAEAVEQAVVAL